MRVRAKAVTGQKYSGYYDHKRRVAGEAFTLIPITKTAKDGRKITISPEQQFSDRWMERIDPKAPFAKPIEQPASEEIQGDDVI
jgi:hypothetical protein